MVTRLRRRSGFTMIELLVVMAILGVLAAAILPLGETLLASRQEAELRRALLEIRGGIDEYKRAVDKGMIARATESGYPPTLEVLAAGVPDQRPEGAGKQMYFLRSIPRDPLANPTVDAAASWRLRSYASPPNLPMPGQDVFDVHSSSGGTALDGSLYATW